MFDWFRGKPKCPVDNSTKTWIETCFSWLSDEFGIDRLVNGQIILPTEEFLPKTYDCTEEGIHDLMCRVACYMDVDPSTLNLGFYEDETPQYFDVINVRSSGQYTMTNGKHDIWLEVHSLEDPASVIATLSHEIGNAILLGQNRVSPEDPDQEHLTDLLIVFKGLGIFAANSVIQESQWREGEWSGWSVGKRGYLSMDMHGYAMSLLTLARNAPTPKWANHLRPDVRAALKQGIRYIQETKDCEFHPAIQGG